MLKLRFVLFFLLMSCAVFAQKKVVKKEQVAAKTIEIYTDGLDDFVLENTTSSFVEVYLYAENPEEKHISLTKNTQRAQLKFNIKIPVEKEIIFRKFITERLERARVIVKIPKGKQVTIYGQNINIASKSYKGNLRVFLENGIVKLGTVQQNVALTLYGGNVYGKLHKTNIFVESKQGNIVVNTNPYKKKYTLQKPNYTEMFKIVSQKANIFLTTE